MSSNFSFLQQDFSTLYPNLYKAERHVINDPMVAAILCRKSLEEFVKWLYDNDEDLEIPYDTTLNTLMHEPSFGQVIPARLLTNLHLVRKIGNNAAHGNANAIEVKESIVAIKAMYDFTLWFARLYGGNTIPKQEFDEGLIPRGEQVQRNKKETEALQQQYEDVQQKLERANKELKHNEALMLALQQKLDAVQAVKEENKSRAIPQLSITEAETRSIYVDTLLKEAGWDITIPGCCEYEVCGMPHSSGIGYADYVLWDDNGKPLAVVEAKKTTRDVYEGKQQAWLYANCLEQMTKQRPVIFYTNGFETYLWDDAAGYSERLVHGFYSKEELQLLINRRSIKASLKSWPVNKVIAGRYYQEEAIKRVADRLDSKGRGALLVMATGSGKTRTAAAIVDMLTKANWAKKILFLADRNALVTQAKNAFNVYLSQLTAIDLTREAEDTASRVVFSTYPTMMNRIDSVKSEGCRYYGVGHFDVVIIDEAHRSVYMKYRAIFDYFDAIFIGLTATPKSEMAKDTYELFGLEQHNPTFAYELDTAVMDKFLVPPRAIKVPLRFPTDGIKYDDLSDEEKESYEKEFLDGYGEMPREVSGGAVNTWLFNEDTIKKVLEQLWGRGLKIEGGDRLGKTIIFARNHDHALEIKRVFNKHFPLHGNMMELIDNYAYNAQELIYRFSDTANNEFQIAVSVDMLDTGIDIPEVVNLVFFKRVRSKAKFWQMVGRGTRLSPDLFGPGIPKEFFYIFDICANMDFFSAGIKETETEAPGTLSQRIFNTMLHIAFLVRQRQNIGTTKEKLAESIVKQLCDNVNTLRDDDFRVRMELRFVHKYQDPGQWASLTHSDFADIQKHISHLYTDERSEESAKRFDLLMYNIMLKDLQSDRTEYYINQVQSIAGGLRKKMGIPAVKDKEVLINALQQDEFWKDKSIVDMEDIRVQLRSLVQYIDRSERPKLYTNFEDSYTGNIEEAEVLSNYSNLETYKKRVEKFIRDNQHHITIHRIRTNQPITGAELTELERLLFTIDEHGNRELLGKITNGQPLAKFIRSIIGLDINTAKEAFSEFLSKGNFRPAQIQFINTIIDYLSQNGTIENNILFDKPFTNINDQGLTGVFEHADAMKVINVLERINANAMLVA